MEIDIKTGSQAGAVIYQTLKDEIIKLILEPGQNINEIDVSKRFHVSRTPVREVFKRLEIEGLIKTSKIRNQGTSVTPIYFPAISELLFVKEKVETSIIEENLENIDTRLNQVHFKMLLAKQKEIIENTQMTKYEKAVEFLSQDNKFHFYIFDLVNARAAWNWIFNKTPDYYRFLTALFGVNTDKSLMSIYEQHCEIVKCISNRDLKMLKAIYRAHSYSNIEDFNKIIEEKKDYFSF